MDGEREVRKKEQKKKKKRGMQKEVGSTWGEKEYSHWRDKQ